MGKFLQRKGIFMSSTLSRIARHATMALLCCLIAGCSQNRSDETEATQRPKVAYITNGIASFWTFAEKGAQDAAQVAPGTHPARVQGRNAARELPGK